METWETMSRAARDAAYDNRLAVGAEATSAFMAAMIAASAATRARYPGLLAIPFHADPDLRWDLFPGADPAAPCLVFLFGGWWQRNSRETFSRVAEGVLAHGWSAALPDYPLAPGASLTAIAAAVRAALDWLAREGPARGIAGPIILAGWSAGGHLAALAADHPAVAAALPISGAFELGPLRDCPSINDNLRLTDAEIETLSPMRRPPVAKPLSIAYGSRELPRMIANSANLHAMRAGAHLPGSLIPVAGADHFTVLDELAASDGTLTRAALSLAEDVRRHRPA
jgi:acetyl esterase/lipase